MSVNDPKQSESEVRKVADFHRYSDLDNSQEAQHHTLGFSATQAAPGDHNHNGSNSSYLFTDVKVTGSLTDGTALKNLLGILAGLGLQDETS